MAVPYVISTLLFFLAPSNSDPNMPSVKSKVKSSTQVVDVECTSISLEYLSGGISKKVHSENCGVRNKTSEVEDKFLEDGSVQYEAGSE